MPTPHWGPAQVQQFLGEFLDFLASPQCSEVILSRDVLEATLEQLRQRLKASRHHAPSLKKLTDQFLRHAGLAGGTELDDGVPPRPAGAGGGATYEVVTGAEEGAPDDPSEHGFYRHQGGRSSQLTNFSIALTRRVIEQDDVTPSQRFEGTLAIAGREVPLAIDVAAYASDPQLKAAVYAAAGPGAQIHCKVDELRNAIASRGGAEDVIATTNFGWDSSGTRFLVPSGVVTADGYRAYGPGDEARVDLAGQGVAAHLGFRCLPAERLLPAKRHVVNDLLRAHDSRVTYCLLAAVALAVLYRHADGLGRFALWLRGLTGAGKSFTAKLFANFFGDFPVSSGRFATWGSTPNFVQNQGYYFKDALYLVDDFKPDVTRYDQVVRVLQAYADNAARGRLNSRAVASPTREVRGILVSTAEDLPEHSASLLARTVAVTVPQRPKEMERGLRCLQWSPSYSGVMADFVRHLLAEGWTGRFAGEVQAAQRRLLDGVPSRQNDARVAANLALLGTAFAAFCDYLRDVWPGAADAASEFAASDLVTLRAETLAGSREQQTSEVFLHVLAGLVENGHAKIENYGKHNSLAAGVPVVGRAGTVTAVRTVFVLCTSLCLEAVNGSLKTQGRPIVAATERALLEQLRADGKIITPTPQEGGARGRATIQVALSVGNRRGFQITEETLLGRGPA